MKKLQVILILVSIVNFSFANTIPKKQLPDDVLKKLNGYNVTLNTLGTTGSMESMPVGS